nr:NAD(P)-binding domain-containing protein [Candidatus Omnitrophota bacterium]
MNTYTSLEKKILDKTAVVGVIGLGYVGLPMAIQFSRKGFNVIGLDSSKKRIARLKKGESYIGDMKDEDIAEASSTGKFSVTANNKALSKCDVIIICVPT